MVKSYETVQPVPFGSYQLVERLAMGGMAEVYLARPNGQQRFVALKRILPNIAADDEFIAMFIDEAKIAGHLSHTNIAQILDLGKIDKSYFIAMEYVSGHDLRALWDRTRDAGDNGKTTMPIGLACYAVKKICDGLDFAHRKRDPKGRPLGIIHRDVSPQNIIVSYDGDLKIIDFGIAKAANRLSKTQTGILKGKFAYMAPEQARGDPIDHRADIFAIGVILYELLTGERAFKAESDFALLEKVRRVDVVAPRTLRADIPRDLERIIYKALAKEAGDRYAWASALGADLDRFMSDQGYASSKEELGGFVQRSFKAELAEEKKRLASYEALFDDDAGEASSSTIMRGKRPISLGSGGNSDDDDDEEGTAVGDSVDESGPTSFEPPTMRGATGSDPRGSSVGSDTGQLIGLRDEARRLAEEAERQTARDTGGDSIEDDEIDASEEASALGKAVGTGLGRPTDETQLDPDAPIPPPRPPPASGVIARDEVPKKLRLVAGAANAGHAGNANGWQGGSNSAPRPPPLVEEKPERADRRAERPDRPDRPDRPERPERPERPDRSDRTERPERVERPERTSGPTPRPVVAEPRASVGVVLAAALLGAVIGGGLIGIAWLATRPTTTTVVFVATPRQAEVREGDVVLCAQTPCAVELEPGKHELLFRAPGAEELSRSVEVKAEGTPPIEVILERTREDVRLETSPPGATVSLDDKPLAGTTPLTLPRLVVGKNVRLKLQRDGFEPLEVNRTVDEEGVWSYDLPTSTTVWSLTADPPDALFEGPGRERDGKLVVTVGKKSVNVRLQRPGCADRQVTLYATGRPDAEQKVLLECRKRDAGLIIDVPRRVQVRVDGVEVPRAASLDPYPLPAGTWTVMLRGSRGRSETHTVELRAGETLKVPTKIR